jgi:Asp-tRNA(Asn)/Glu-tRNA(Gln) amidotransferase A subunit family amidase
MTWCGSLDLGALRAAYAARTVSPEEVVATIHDRIEAAGETQAWIHLVPREEAMAAARATPRGALHGIPFSVKDCNDVPGLPTTNACPPTRYVAERTGQAITRLLEAGAVCLGKTNMDQFGALPSGLHLGRVELRLGGQRRAGAGELLDRQRRRRIGPRAGGLLQHRRPEADPGPGFQRLRHGRRLREDHRDRVRHGADRR